MVSRATTSRAATSRALPATDRESRLWIDPERIPPNMSYKFVRERVTGLHDKDNVSLALREGWRPVPAERHPEVAAIPLPGEEPDKYVRSGGQLLMERPKEMTEAEEEARREDHDDVLRSVGRDQQVEGEHFHAARPVTQRRFQRAQRPPQMPRARTSGGARTIED